MIYPLADLPDNIEIGLRFKAHGTPVCSRLEDGMEAEVTSFNDKHFELDGCPHEYSEGGSVETC